jgi:sterol desaturase/sphingolipid hydroxylase (fatty acid hydroxylase superfamily)
MLASHGELEGGRGFRSGVIAFVLAALSVLSVIAFHFPEYLTTPDLRNKYDADVLRYVLGGALVVAGGLALYNLIRGRSRWLASWALGLVAVALLLGGPTVQVDDFPDHTPYLGLDFLVLDLLGSSLVFVLIEKLFALRKEQPIFRPQWQTDLVHFAVNHLLVGATLFLINGAIFRLGGGSPSLTLVALWDGLPLWAVLPVLVLVADLAQYWLHRAYHEVPWLWRIHAVHHSASHMDWIAGSRLHLVEVLLTRVVVLAPLHLLGFPRGAIDAYIVIVGAHAVFNHANVSARFGPLSRVIVTPNFHHFHHSQDDVAIDKNYASHYAFLDHLFGTAVKAEREWPERYGVVGDYVPNGFVRQLLFPFIGPRGGVRKGAGAGSPPGEASGD